MFLLMACFLQVECEGMDGEVLRLVVPGAVEINRIVESNCHREITLRGLQSNLKYMC